jgi:multicomponent Na+:H+ antiporter subunit F
VIPLIYVVLALAAVCFAYRLLRGPFLADRVMGMDGLLIVGVSMIAVHGVQTRSGVFLPVAVLITLLGFISTAVIARFIEGQGR